jgi:hypothetical protein
MLNAFATSLFVIQRLQADYRRSTVATKLKVIYVKDTVLDVRSAAGLLDAVLTSSHSRVYR